MAHIARGASRRRNDVGAAYRGDTGSKSRPERKESMRVASGRNTVPILCSVRTVARSHGKAVIARNLISFTSILELHERDFVRGGCLQDS